MPTTAKGLVYPSSGDHTRIWEHLQNLATSIETALDTLLPPGAWSTYTPSWGALTTNPVLGNGTIAGRYRQRGKTVEMQIKLTFGSTTTVGSGTYTFGLPVPFAASSSLLLPARYFDSSTSVRSMGMSYGSSGASIVLAVHGSATNGALGGVTNSSPYAWANGDTIEVGGLYEAA